MRLGIIAKCEGWRGVSGRRDRDWDRGRAPDGAVGIGIGELRFSKLACHRLRGKGNHEVVEGGG